MGEEIEIWKDIEDYIGLYKVSSFGRIRSTKSELFRKFTLNRDGYLYINLCKEGKTKNLKVHRLVAIHFCEKIELKSHVDHIDGNKQNNYSVNLRWCTHAENIQFAWDLGIYDNIGSKHRMSKLIEDEVIQIKKLISSGGKNYIIAKQFNVSQQTICDIRKGRLWNHI